MQFSLTSHACSRSQQRGFGAASIDLLMEFGSEMRHRGADILFFDKAARRRMEAALAPEKLRQVRRQDTNAYIVIGDRGRIVTISHRRQRLKRR